METLTYIGLIAAGLGLGLLFGWLYFRPRFQAFGAQIKAAEAQRYNQQQEAEQAIAAISTELQELREQLGMAREESTDFRSRLSGVSAERDSLRDQQAMHLHELEKLRGQLLALSNDLERSQTERRAVDRRMAEKESEITEMRQQLARDFENLANRIFDEKTQKLTAKNTSDLGNLLAPLKERINTFERSIRETHEQQLRERTDLKAQLRELSQLNNQMLEDARNLTQALKGDAKVQGNWGEVILERVLEKSGLVRGREYRVQEVSYNDDGRRLQPDVVVDLPEDKKIVIDSKVSLTAYERYMSAPTDEEQLKLQREHLHSVTAHIRRLSRKNYQEIHGINSPDFVILFVPVEPALNLALHLNSELYVEAFEQNIVIVTPTTLLATLSVIASLWKQENQNRNVLDIARESGALYDKFYGLINDLKDVGKRMEASRRSYEAAMGKLQTGKGNLVSRVEKIKQLGAKTTKTLPREMLDNAAEDGQLF